MPRSIALFVLAIALAGITACEKSPPTASSLSEPPPEPNSPVNALHLFEWSYDHRSIEQYRRLFTDDFRFFFSDLDSSGDAYRVIPWTREDELVGTRHLFVSARTIELTMDHFIATADPRPGKNPIWHKSVNAQVALHVVFPDGHTEDMSGSAKFFFTRGDSALIPDDLGAAPDPATWYIDRWDDETGQSGASSFGAGASNPTWGALKRRYRSLYFPGD
jgi:hypothetical protein